MNDEQRIGNSFVFSKVRDLLLRQHDPLWTQGKCYVFRPFGLTNNAYLIAYLGTNSWEEVANRKHTKKYPLHIALQSLASNFPSQMTSLKLHDSFQQDRWRFHQSDLFDLTITAITAQIVWYLVTRANNYWTNLTFSPSILAQKSWHLDRRQDSFGDIRCVLISALCLNYVPVITCNKQNHSPTIHQLSIMSSFYFLFDRCTLSRDTEWQQQNWDIG